MSMKKKYDAPMVEIVECVPVQIIAASSEQLVDGGEIPMSQRSNNRSSSWGNIWNN